MLSFRIPLTPPQICTATNVHSYIFTYMILKKIFLGKKKEAQYTLGNAFSKYYTYMHVWIYIHHTYIHMYI